MPARSPLHSRGLGTLIGLVALLTGAGAIGNGTQAPIPPVTTSPATGPSTPGPQAAAQAPSGTAPTTTPSSLHPMVEATPAPPVKGDPRLGAELRISKPAWRPAGVTLAYQWLRDGVPIAGATTRHRTVTVKDLGHRLSVRLTGTRAGFETAVQETAAVGPVVGAKLATSVPWVSGRPRVGNVLVGRVRPWGPGIVPLTWQWYRDGAKIPGATAPAYRLVAADAGHRMTVKARGSAPRFESATQFSAPTAGVIPGALSPTPVPVYSGVAQVGQTLTALPRRWGPGAVTLTYQWFRSGEAGEELIVGATRARYLLVEADAGHRLRVRVTGSLPGYNTVERHSAWTNIVRPASAAAGPTHRHP